MAERLGCRSGIGPSAAGPVGETPRCTGPRSVLAPPCRRSGRSARRRLRVTWRARYDCAGGELMASRLWAVGLLPFVVVIQAACGLGSPCPRSLATSYDQPGVSYGEKGDPYLSAGIMDVKAECIPAGVRVDFFVTIRVEYTVHKQKLFDAQIARPGWNKRNIILRAYSESGVVLGKGEAYMEFTQGTASTRGTEASGTIANLTPDQARRVTRIDASFWE